MYIQTEHLLTRQLLSGWNSLEKREVLRRNQQEDHKHLKRLQKASYRENTEFVEHNIQINSLSMYVIPQRWTRGVDYSLTVVGPSCLVERTITGEIYLDVRTISFAQTDYTERAHATDVFQQESAQPHVSLWVRLALNARFSNWWIGRHGSIAWPLKMSWFNTTWYFHVGVCRRHRLCCDLNHLPQRINATVATVMQGILHLTWMETLVLGCLYT